MLNLSTYERVANWNEARYSRIYNNELTCNMIDEELGEYFDNIDNEVEKLDALGDIMFVAMGALWKIGFDSLDEVVATNEWGEDHSWLDKANSIPSVVLAISFSKAIRFGFIAPKEGLMILITLAFAQAESNGYTGDQFKRAVLTICDSNDTKAVERVSPDVKANLNKGEQYVSPTKALTKIVEEMLHAK